MQLPVANEMNHSVPALSPSLTRNQIRGFWASWGGWTLDGMDSFVYALVLVPSLRELLPRSGVAATKGNIGLYGGLLFALFLIGWGLAFLWGPIGDKFGRVRTLMLTILWYSVFTFLSAFVTGVWQLAILRLLAGVGIGGEWAMGGTFVAEEWPESRRRVGAGLMHTGYYVGIFLAALANYGIGSRFGWRAMFIVGGLPALLLAWVRHGVTEPAAWTKKEKVVRAWAVWRPLATLFSPLWRRRTIVNSFLMLASICGLWAGTVYVPAAITSVAEAGGRNAAQAAQLASWGTMLVSFATILGCLAMPSLEDQERIFVNKFVYRLEPISRGDIVVFRYPRDPSKSYIKRVVGAAGDRIRIDGGQVYVNGEALDEDYVPPAYADSRSYPEMVVPAESYFVLGDHRSMSNDSRDFGPVNQSYIYGKAVFGYWPMDKLGRVR